MAPPTAIEKRTLEIRGEATLGIGCYFRDRVPVPVDVLSDRCRVETRCAASGERDSWGCHRDAETPTFGPGRETDLPEQSVVVVAELTILNRGTGASIFTQCLGELQKLDTLIASGEVGRDTEPHALRHFIGPRDTEPVFAQGLLDLNVVGEEP